MFRLVSLVCLAVAPGQEAAVQDHFIQVAPSHSAEQPVTRSAGQNRAVVLIQELGPNKKGNLEWHSYQRAGSPLIKQLASQADVFALGYEETTAVTEIARSPAFRQRVQLLRDQGYTEIVLVGFGTGGLVARQFVEDVPDAGVTKVIQVGCPNLGLRVGVGKDDFHKSLSRQPRHEFFKERLDTTIPEAVQFVCVVDTGWVENLALMKGEEWTMATQWPQNLQNQGIPARVLTTKYLWSSFSDEGARLITELVKENLPRWNKKEVDAMRRVLYQFIDKPDGA